MPYKLSVDVRVKRPQHLVPAMLNRRRISLKKILARYMGLHFTQYQPIISSEDIAEAGLEDAYLKVIREISPASKKRNHVAAPVDVEVRGVAIALDEEISFSYYRNISLNSPIYRLPLSPRVDRYKQFCQQHMQQQESLLSTPIERALRKRAIHDFMQDMLPAVHHMPVVRLSVHDWFTDGDDFKCLGSILSDDDERFYLPVADYITEQLEEVDTLFLSQF